MDYQYSEFSHQEWSQDSHPGRLLVNFHLEVMLPVEGETWRGRARINPQTHSWRGAGRYGIRATDIGHVVSIGEGLLRALADAYPPDTATQSRFHAMWHMHDENGEPMGGHSWTCGMSARGLLEHATGTFRMMSAGPDKRDSRTSFPNLREVGCVLGGQYEHDGRPNLVPQLVTRRIVNPLPHDMTPPQMETTSSSPEAWIVMEPPHYLWCQRCDARATIRPKAPLPVLFQQMEAFRTQHASCVEAEKPALPTHNKFGAPLPESVVVVSRTELDAMPEYTMTLPTYALESGALDGPRRFKRNADGQNSMPPLWIVCQAFADAADGNKINLVWSRADVQEEGNQPQPTENEQS